MQASVLLSPTTSVAPAVPPLELAPPAWLAPPPRAPAPPCAALAPDAPALPAGSAEPPAAPVLGLPLELAEHALPHSAALSASAQVPSPNPANRPMTPVY